MADATHRRRRVFLYVDGFNLYHRRLECQPALKWLSLRALAENHLFRGDDIAVIKFFTARVDPGAPADHETPKQRRQSAYWSALRATRVEIVLGLLESRERECQAAECDRRAKYRQMCEKMSDVNLALHIYRDYVEQQPDVVCVISGDCDVLPALQMVRQAARARSRTVMLVVYLPVPDDGLLFSRLPQHYQLARTAKLGESALRLSQFAERVSIGAGEWAQRPDVWT